MSAALLFPSPLPADDGKSSPLLRDVLPPPSLVRDLLHAALEKSLREDGEIIPLVELSADPRAAWAGALAKNPVLCTGRDLRSPGPLVLLLESPRDPDLQTALRRTLESLPDSLTLRLEEAGPAPFPPVELFRKIGDEGGRRAAADLLMDLGVISARQHFSLTTPSPVHPEFLENRETFRRRHRSQNDVSSLRSYVLTYSDVLARALEPVEQRSFDLELWALEKNRAAFETGELEAPEYLRHLLNQADAAARAPLAATGQVRLLMEALSLEEGLDFERAGEERDLLIETLHGRLGAQDHAGLLRDADAFADGRLSAGRHSRGLLALAKTAGVPATDTPAFSRFSRYADLIENLDAAALKREMRGMENVLFGPGRNTPAQTDLLALVRDLRSFHRAAETFSDDGSTEEGALWDARAALVGRAEKLAQAVDLTVPLPAFSWPDAVAAMRNASRELRQRATLLAANALRKKRPVSVLLAEPPLLRPLADALKKQGAAVVLLSPVTGTPPEARAAAAARAGAARAALARAWNLPDLAWDDAGVPGAGRAAAALLSSLMTLFPAIDPDLPPTGTLPPGELKIRMKSLALRRFPEGGELRLNARAEPLPPVVLVWRWTSSSGDPKDPPGFQDAGKILLEGTTWRVSFHAESGLRGPWRWGAAQVRAVKSATQRFFRMQKKATLLTGAWMAGGVLLSVFAGAVSTVFLVAWLVVGVGVLVRVIFFGRDPAAREEWMENLKTIGEKRKAFLERLLSLRRDGDF